MVCKAGGVILAAGDMSNVTPASLPKVTFSVHAWGRKIGMAIPTGTRVPQDLIFGVECTADDGASYRLKRLEVTVALGDASSSKQDCRMTNYRGPGATAPGNIRLCPRLAFGSKGASLKILLVTRSRVGTVPVQNVEEMGFILPMAEVNEYEEPVTVKLSYVIHWDSNLDEGTFKVSFTPA
jgi:hypothetical protein